MFSKLLQNRNKSLLSKLSPNLRYSTHHALQQIPIHHHSHTSSYNQYLLAMSAALALSLSSYLTTHHTNPVHACGIMGMISSDEEVVDYLLEGLTILQNRGYDSAGIATISNEENDLVCTKYASVGTTSDSLDLLAAACPTRHASHRCGIAHTRWATHGAKTDRNAHPHCDFASPARIALVHNGTISNCTELKNELREKGIEFESETDTEVIANLIGYYLDKIEENPSQYAPQTNGNNDVVAIAFELALNRLDGSWGIAMVSASDRSKIYAARNGSPLMIGLDSSNGRNFIASEHTAFAKYTRNYISLNEGEMAVVTANDISIEDSHSRIKTVAALDAADYATSPSPYEFWTEKEIMEQPQAVSHALQFGARLSYGNSSVMLGGLQSNLCVLNDIRNLIITGCGTSLNAGLYAKRLMEHLRAFDTVCVVDSAEVISDIFPPHASDSFGILAISQSGETKDVLSALAIADAFGIPRFSVVNAVGSAIARETGCGVYCYAGRENAVASTKAFTSQVTVLSLIAAWFSQLEGRDGNKHRCKQLVDSLHRLHTYVGAVIHNAREECKRIAQFVVDNQTQHIFVLGKGFAEPIAYEGALKIKEITYIHAEGYSGGALKHGPFALIDENVPVIMIILDDEHKKVMVTNAHEIEARHGKMIYITDNKQILSGLAQQDRIIQIPKNGPLTALLAVIPLQLIAYYIAMYKKINPDKPRNLAKAVTVV
eukprot:249723_1